MTQKDKDLLLKDLCARLPYRVKGHYKYYDIIGGKECLTDENDGDITSIDINLGNPIKINGYYTEVEYVKPYLRSILSITEDEKEELYQKTGFKIDDCILGPSAIDWFNSHHFDYRGLIPKGLALEASEEMYN